ncbi:hypothetical protein ACFL2C_02175 [Patescibacteria group bacterium]
MSGTTTNQVLGASTAAVGGVAVLPYTGDNPVLMILPILAAVLGTTVLATLLTTRVLRKLN